MESDAANTSRRAFFVKGGAALGAGAAALGAGVAAAGPAAAGDSTQPREAIRQLHQAFTRLIEQRDFDAAATLFDERAELELSGESASGGHGIATLLTRDYRNQTVAALHEAYRPNARQHEDRITLVPDGRAATAIWHVDVAVAVPLRDDSTAAQMARLQGHLAGHHWESGRLEARYVKSGVGWKIATLRYLKA